jgi:alcohol dehydrogenase YqhD (iron-dependent ADH family)
MYIVHAERNPVTMCLIMNIQLQTEVRRYQLLRERVFHEFPGTDDETIRDTLEGITDFHEMIAAVTGRR